jgi:tol-pal system protein YbgF
VANSSAQASQLPPQPVAASQGELFYQLQLLQEEVRMLRGLVEEQGHQLGRLQQQSRERYIDLDRRIAAASAGAVTAQPESSGIEQSAEANTANDSAAKNAYEAAYRLVPAKQFEQALAAFEAFLQQYPQSAYAANSYYWIGELYQVVAPVDLEASRQAFTQLLSQYPEHSKAADAMYKLGKVYFQKGNAEQSRQWLDRVIAEHRNSGAAGKAKQFLKDNF